MKKIKKQIVKISHILSKKNLVSGFDGNISVRAKQGFWITANKTYKGILQEEEIVLIDYEGNIIKGKKKPSSEYRLHAAIYEKRKDVQAIIHAHPLYATALTIAGLPFIPCLTAEAFLVLGQIPTAPYQAPGSQALAESIVPFLSETNVILLEKHGAIAYGNSLLEAIDLLEKLESASQKILLMHQNQLLNNSVLFSLKQRQELFALKKTLSLLSRNCECKNEQCGLLL